MGIGARIKSLREARGISQRELEKRAGVNNLCRIESADVQNPRLDTIRSIADALSVPVEDLVRDIFQAPGVTEIPQGQVRRVSASD